MAQQATIREQIVVALPFRGPVVLSDAADVTITVTLDFDSRHDGGVHMTHPAQSTDSNGLMPHSASSVQGLPLDRLRRVFVGVSHKTRRATHVELALSRRAYLGPTSLEPLLALAMCNMAGVKPGSLVLDPFVGTGSVLVAAARFGGATFGIDIDYRVLCMGKAGRTVSSNFEQYGLPLPELLRADMAELCLRGSATAGLFDAVVCDPPYGVRAGVRQSDEGTNRSQKSRRPGSSDAGQATPPGELIQSAERVESLSVAPPVAAPESLAQLPAPRRTIPRTRALEGEQASCKGR
jgi:predicted RNA methylase